MTNPKIPALATAHGHEIAWLYADIINISNRRFRAGSAVATVKKFETLCERHGMRLVTEPFMRGVRKRAEEHDDACRAAYRKIFCS